MLKRCVWGKLNIERAESMEVKAVQDIFIKILRSELTETELDDSVKEQITPNAVSFLYSLANRHDLAFAVLSSLHKCGLTNNDEIYAKFHQKAIMSVFRNEQIKYAFAQICDTFNQASIPYIPLKGSVIRPFYPQESMRTSCDIDILIKEDHLADAIDAIVQKGFRCGERNYHDVSLFSQANVHLELHFNIQENIDKLDAVLKDAWRYAELTDGSQYQFTDEFFVFHMFAHMSYHFLSGGCGMKSLMDIWVMEYKMGITYECARELLEKADIYRFAAEISKLANICFSGEAKDEFSDTILSYIFSGGVYGTNTNRVAVQQQQKGGSVKYALSKIFIPYDTIKFHYPILQKYRFLTPIMEVRRWGKLIFCGHLKRTVKELKFNGNISKEEALQTRRLLEKLGLNKC